MPKVTDINGISIYFYSNEHLPPHVHAKIGDFEMRMEFRGNTEIINGKNKKAQSIVELWVNNNWQVIIDKWNKYFYEAKRYELIFDKEGFDEN